MNNPISKRSDDLLTVVNIALVSLQGTITLGGEKFPFIVVISYPLRYKSLQDGKCCDDEYKTQDVRF